MRRTVQLFGILVAMAMAAPGLRAQEPGAPGAPPAGGLAGMRPAEFLLAHTGDLQLTDAQVTRLAAIARRGEAQRKAMRASFDSLRALRLQAVDSARRGGQRPGPGQALAALRPDLQRLRDQRHVDYRDAIAVLTPDQQATLFEMLTAGRGMAARAAGLARQRAGAGMYRPRVLPRRPLQGAPGAAPVRPQ